MYLETTSKKKGRAMQL